MPWILEIVLLVLRAFLLFLQVLIHKFQLSRFLNLLQHKILTALHPCHKIVKNVEKAIIFLKELDDLILVCFVSSDEDVVKKTKSFVAEVGIVVDVDETEHESWDLSVEHDVLPFF